MNISRGPVRDLRKAHPPLLRKPRPPLRSIFGTAVFRPTCFLYDRFLVFFKVLEVIFGFQEVIFALGAQLLSWTEQALPPLKPEWPAQRGSQRRQLVMIRWAQRESYPSPGLGTEKGYTTPSPKSRFEIRKKKFMKIWWKFKSPQQPAWPISLDIATNAVLSSMQASRVLPPAWPPTQCLRRQGTSSWPGISHAAAQYPRGPCSALLRYGPASPTHFIWSCCVQSHGLFRDTPSALFNFKRVKSHSAYPLY